MLTRSCLVATLLWSIAAGGQESFSAPAAVRDIHTRTITPSSDALFAAESEPPATDEAWTRLQASASALEKSGDALQSLAQAKREKRWRDFATSLRNEASGAARAAKARSIDGLVEANGRIVAVCEACHDEYRDGGHGMTSDKQPAPKQ